MQKAGDAIGGLAVTSKPTEVDTSMMWRAKKAWGNAGSGEKAAAVADSCGEAYADNANGEALDQARIQMFIDRNQPVRLPVSEALMALGRPSERHRA